MATNNFYGYPPNSGQPPFNGSATNNMPMNAPPFAGASRPYPVQPPVPGVGPSSFPPRPPRPGYQAHFQSTGNATPYTTTSSSAVPYDYSYRRDNGPAPPPPPPGGHSAAPPQFDATKSYYQQNHSAPAVSYASPAQHYDNNPNKNNYPSVPYASVPLASQYQRNMPGANPPQPQSQPPSTKQQHSQESKPGQGHYSNYDAALYSAASMYVAQQSNKSKPTYWNPGCPPPSGNRRPSSNNPGPNANNVNGNNNGNAYAGRKIFNNPAKPRPKPQPKPQQLHYCEVCKISCAGPQTYREHLDGQKHKKREATLRAAQSNAVPGSVVSAAGGSQPQRANNLRCDLCDVTCTGADAYAAHVRGTKHQKVVKLHQRLGKPIPDVQLVTFVQAANLSTTPTAAGTPIAAPLTGTTTPAKPKNAPPSKAVPSGSTSDKPIGPVAPPNIVAAAMPAIAAPATDDDAMDVSPDGVFVVAAAAVPVGVEYIEQIRSDDGKTTSFNCKLCDCKFNDPNAKEMHMKGRRHRLQYKKKVQPDLVVDIKPNPRQRRLAEAKAERAAATAEYYNNARMHPRQGMDMDCGGTGGDDDFYEAGRGRGGYEDDYAPAVGPMAWPQRGHPLGMMPPSGGPMPYGPHRGLAIAVGAGPMHMRPPPPSAAMFGLAPNGRRPESSDDRHVVARHAEIYPKEEELQTIQRIVSHTERALKFVSDALAQDNDTAKAAAAAAAAAAVATQPTSEPTGEQADVKKEAEGDADKAPVKVKEDGRDNQMFSFQKDAEGSIRILRGVMRVGLLAKGLLLRGDNLVQLVVLCGEKPTNLLLDRVAEQFPIALAQVHPEHTYSVQASRLDSAVLVSDGTITVKVSLTSPMLRDPQAIANAAAADQAAAAAQGADDLLPREPCLQALAALRHAKWFQARATGLQSCVMVMRILRDLCARTPTWSPLNQYAMELFVEKVIQSAHVPLSPGDCVRRVMEAISTGLLISGPGLLDPCEKDPRDALDGMTKQQREDLTVSAQTFLRYIAFRQMHVVLGMEALPAPKYQKCPWRFARKRRRSTTVGGPNGTGENAGGGGGEESAPKISKTPEMA